MNTGKNIFDFHPSSVARTIPVTYSQKLSSEKCLELLDSWDSTLAVKP